MPVDVSVLAGLGTAACWMITALPFEYAGKRIGASALEIAGSAVAVAGVVVLALT